MTLRSPRHAWTPERTARLKILWASFYSGPEIAEIMGGLTAKAVQAQARRLGLQRRNGRMANAPPSKRQLRQREVHEATRH